MSVPISEIPFDSLRIPPQSVDAEQAVLGALLIAPVSYAEVATRLSEDDFIRNDHRLIYRAIRDHVESDTPFDVITLGDWFENQGMAEVVAGGAYLIELHSNTPSAANVVAYAEIVRDKATLRRLIDVGTNLTNAAFMPDGRDAEDIYAESVGAFARVGTRLQSKDTDPLDLFSDTLPPIMREDYLPPVIARFAFDQAEVKGAAPEIIAMTCLAAASAAIHDGFRIIPKPDEPSWQERACLWTMIVADPGSKKTPAMKAALGVLSGIDNDMNRRYAGSLRQYLDEDRVYRLASREADRRKAKGAMGETVGMDEDLAAPEKPRQERIFVGDATIEKVAELCGDNPRGLCLFRDELSGWFGGMDAYSKGGVAKDRPLWLEAYNGGPRTIDRITRGTQFVENWSMGIIGSIQQDKIKAIVQNSQDDGLFQRFMIIDVPNAYRQSAERPEDAAARKSYEDAIAMLWSRQPGPEGHAVLLDHEADIVRREFFTWVERVSAAVGLPTMLRGHISKWTGLWSRLVLTYHCFGCAVLGKWPTQTPVTVNTARRVTALMQKFLLPQAMQFYTDTVASADPVYGLARHTAGCILAQGVARLTVRDMMQWSKAWRESPQWHRDAVINLLIESGWLIGTDSRRKRGGSDTGWTVNPKCHSMFAERAAIEVERKAALAQGLRDLQEAARQV